MKKKLNVDGLEETERKGSGWLKRSGLTEEICAGPLGEWSQEEG